MYEYTRRWAGEPCVSVSFTLLTHLLIFWRGRTVYSHCDVPGRIHNHELLQICKCCTMPLYFCGFHGNKNKSRTRRERQPDVDEKVQRIRNPQTVSGSKMYCKWMYLTVNSTCMVNGSTLRLNFLVCRVTTVA